MLIPDPGGYMLFFFDGWLSVIRIILMVILSYAGIILALRSTEKSLSSLNSAQAVTLLAMGVLIGFSLLNIAIPILNFVLALFLLVAVFYIVSR